MEIKEALRNADTIVARAENNGYVQGMLPSGVQELQTLAAELRRLSVLRPMSEAPRDGSKVLVTVPAVGDVVAHMSIEGRWLDSFAGRDLSQYVLSGFRPSPIPSNAGAASDTRQNRTAADVLLERSADVRDTCKFDPVLHALIRQNQADEITDPFLFLEKVILIYSGVLADTKKQLLDHLQESTQRPLFEKHE